MYHKTKFVLYLNKIIPKLKRIEYAFMTYDMRAFQIHSSIENTEYLSKRKNAYLCLYSSANKEY